MREWSRGVGIVIGAGAAMIIAPYLLGTEAARASRAGARLANARLANARLARTRLIALSDNLDISYVALNQVVEIRFNARIAKSSLEDGSISIRPLVDGALGDARPGKWGRRRNVVHFLPTLPTHAIDPDDPTGGFYPPGSPNDDAFENGSFRPGTTYVIVLSGRSHKPAVRSLSHGSLKRTATSSFRTAPRTTDAPLFLREDYVVDPPPRVKFTNPPDSAVNAADSYTNLNGTHGVPIAASVTVFGTGIPFDPTTLRAPGAVQLIRVAPLVGGEIPSPIAGRVVVDQDRSQANFTFLPAAPLDEETTYALRVSRSVSELSGTFQLPDNPERARLQEIGDHLAAARARSPGVPPEQLPDPPIPLIFDWPSDPVERGIMKGNLLEVRDAAPVLIDPRVFAVFTTRDEPIVLVLPDDASTMSPRRTGKLAQVTRAVTPLGLQGSAGGGYGNVVIPFSLFDRRGRRSRVEAHFGIDLNRDGIVGDDEFRPLTDDRRDGRVTGADRLQSLKHGWTFFGAAGKGRSNALVWNSRADLPNAVHRTIDYVYTDHGRTIPAPNDAHGVLFDAALPGVVVRVRTKRGKRRSGGWVYTRPFGLSNATAPYLTFGEVTAGPTTLIDWTAFDADGEDTNGDDVLDPLNLEDRNGNGVLDYAVVAVAFDHAVLADGVDPSALAVDELAALDWYACTRDPRFGDPDIGLDASSFGKAYTFAWDSAGDGLDPSNSVILRARPFDETRTRGAWVYRTEVITLDN